MTWLHALSWFVGGALLANALPHTVSGVLGRAFQTPFARPRGEGTSTATVNVLWGFFNLAMGYLLLDHVGQFNPHALPCMAVAGTGALLSSLGMARWFGRFNGGNKAQRP
ncbi:hypothetical protein [Dyella sp. A6]|uniref:hypothetical protein n=1 Tax=Dyella aluminiiresistens TaxID=3069105 RepID=UPI002E7A16FC|nr:hypothetical protein [Dyella sp. A6]